MEKKAIVIADDHPIFRLGLQQLINNSNQFTVVAEAENSAKLFTAVNCSGSMYRTLK